ncbi:uncharacterized protein PV09_09447 [Verruconis gallopava]|uniref:rRNA-processing protein FYV7 n=1 Tax=Verruconis gallopava TaxID=253628 RepID=A0A0D1X9F4_9PEZI|nr:uncharacterized protein PV09_09447 [Verruconis gallopava]KIV98795.1 hypothetical protein PV09_09447 [Verruconis gallopava]
MGEKRKFGSAFQVGPANLPDGMRKRKADRIKKALIDRAKIKQDFAKVKRRKLQEQQKNDTGLPQRDIYADAQAEGEKAEASTAAAALHPDREALINGSVEELSTREHAEGESGVEKNKARRKRKLDPFAKEASLAQKQKEAAQRRRAEREEAERQRQQKIRERERLQRMIKKAKRPTADGKRKLGRESGYLLEKVKQMMET